MNSAMVDRDIDRVVWWAKPERTLVDRECGNDRSGDAEMGYG